MKSIPVESAKHISYEFDAPEVIIFAYDPTTGDQHVTTYGKTVEQSHESAKIGNWLKQQLGWPHEKCNDLPTKTIDDV